MKKKGYRKKKPREKGYVSKLRRPRLRDSKWKRSVKRKKQKRRDKG